MKDIMLDLETMGNRPTSAIIQIGACYFDRFSGEIGDKFSANVSLTDSIKHGMTIDASTIEWWMTQENKSWLDKPQQLLVVLSKFNSFYKPKSYVWSHATFDVPILNYSYANVGSKAPYHYRMARDLRTLTHLSGNMKSETTEVRKGEAGAHNALNDCLYQVKYAVECLNKLKG